MTNIFLIRHGEAYGNVHPVLTGMRSDPGLTERGVMQAERLRDRLMASGELKAEVLIASTLPRARQTAEIIAPALNLPLILDDEVQELRLGEADGMTNTDAWERFGEPDFDNQPLRPIAPGGESWGSFMLRVGLALDRISREHAGKHIVIVCHGGVIDGSLIYFMNLPTLRLPGFELYTHNTSITHWQLHRRASVTRWRLMKYNDIAHLHGEDVRESLRWRPAENVADPETSHPASHVPPEDPEQ
jgi:2,3-bisphosphoglycerate-dependent phosphoglycerate mutase